MTIFKSAPLKEFKKILIRMPNWLGDAVMAAPVIDQVHAKWPKAKITLYGLESSLTLFSEHPHVDRLIKFDKKKPYSEEAKKLKAEAFDCGLLLTNSFSSAWIFYVAKIPYRIGFAKDLRSFLLTESVARPKKGTKIHHVNQYQMLLSKSALLLKHEPRLYLQDEERICARHFLEQKGISKEHTVIGVHASAAYGSSKCWIKERFQELNAQLLEDPKVILVYFGDEKAMALNEDLIKGHARAFNVAAQTTIRELMALISQCDLFLTNDSGPMHIACALQKPVVALFGSTSPELTGPYHKGVYLRKPVECSPCFKRECPIDHRCMKAITVEEVYHKILSEISKYSKQEIYEQT